MNINENLKGMNIIESILEELITIMIDYDLNIMKNTIIDVTHVIKEKYESDVTAFKVLTSHIGVVIEDYKWLDDENIIEVQAKVFADDKISSLAQININDMLGLLDLELSSFVNLSKCTFHFNRLYNEDQFGMIPSIKKVFCFKKNR